MKQISIYGGHFALVDDEDFEYLSQWKWHLTKNGYAQRSKNMGKINGKVKIKTYKMHKQIMGENLNFPNIDHKDGNKLNNQRSNLRLATFSQNSVNKKPQDNCLSAFKGASLVNRPKKWRARITVNGKTISLGYFYNEAEAAVAYDKASKIYHKDFSRPNGAAAL